MKVKAGTGSKEVPDKSRTNQAALIYIKSDLREHAVI